MSNGGSTTPIRLAVIGPDSIESMHERLIYPVVRVVSVGHKAAVGGSGVCVYSKPVEEGSSTFESYLLTNHHVIKPLIDIEEKWIPTAGKNIKVETRAEPQCDFFSYEDISRITDTVAKRAELVAWDEPRDLALIKLRSNSQVQYVAPIMTLADEKQKLFIGSPTATVGCGLGVPPLMTTGHLGGFGFLIDNYPYNLNTAPAIYGNSGGPVFLQETGEIIGLIARMNVVLAGFGIDAVTHQTWAIPVTTIAEFLEENFYDFIIDQTKNPKDCHKARADLLEKSKQAMLTGSDDGTS